MLGKLGVKNAITLLPVFTLVGFTAVAVNPMLGTALFLFIVRNGLQTGLDDPAQSVLGAALPAQVGPEAEVPARERRASERRGGERGSPPAGPSARSSPASRCWPSSG